MDLRQYDPAIGRWVVQDPVIHHEFSPYSAFDNNPVYWADPSGADAVPITVMDLFNATENGSNASFEFSNGRMISANMRLELASFISEQLQAMYEMQPLEGTEYEGSKGNGHGGGNGGGNGNGDEKSYKYKGEYYSSSEMLYANLLMETILEEATLAYVYTVASVLDGSGFLLKKEFQTKGASKGTSFASKYLAPAVDKYLKELNLDNKSKLLTHVRGNSLRGTTSVGRFITRWNNNITTVALIYQVANILAKTNMKYTYIINGPYKHEKY